MQIHCLTCKGFRAHSKVGAYLQKSEEDEPIAWNADYEIYTCNGCQTVTYKTTTSNEEDYDDDGYIKYETYYPSREEPRQPKFSVMETFSIPDTVRTTYYEVIKSFSIPVPLLTAVGLRTLIEAICKDKGATKYTLEEKIDEIAATHVLTKELAAILHAHRFLGNAATHQLLAASQHELFTALDIAETVIEVLYVVPAKGKRITTGKKP